ncbi:MAG: hypothetical protein QXD23_02835, partial [Candidatus Micrarchaeaceae archaeon]
MEKKYIYSVEEAIEYFKLMIKNNPDRNYLDATLAAMNGKRRKYSVFYLSYQIRPDDKTIGEDVLMLPEVKITDLKEQN